MTRRIKKTFQTVTEESAADGDFAETGWIDDVGAEITPDEYDLDEHDSELAAVVALAVKEIQSEGSVEPSSSAFHNCGIWYTTVDSGKDYETGEDTTYSFHLEGFLPEEERAIYNAITGKCTKA